MQSFKTKDVYTSHILRVKSVNIMTLTTVEYYSPNFQTC